MGGGGTKTAQNGPDNSLLTFLANVGIVVLVVLNILSLLLGVGIIIVGKYVDSEISKNENVMELLELVDFGDFNLRTVVDALIIIIFIVGAFAIVLSLIGGIGAFFTLRVLLFLYIGIIILVIIVEIAVVSLWVKLLREVDYALETLFLDLLKEYTGFSDITVYTVGWDFIFILFDCCGVHPITASSNDFETLPSAFWTNGDRGSDVIPHACCKDVAVDNYLNYTNTDCTGCYDAFDRTFNQLGSAAVSVASLLVLAELGAIFFSVIIIIAVFKKKRAGLV
ncbi:TSN16-like protein [Mya arenaria]|uniref:TSN16-like protein n=1 Tax=Mya arenaria TaxID=6604 RepID=A0ABY7E0L7_MYAAR|nr:TSN16-like protein [Mya arenaria]